MAINSAKTTNVYGLLKAILTSASIGEQNPFYS